MPLIRLFLPLPHVTTRTLLCFAESFLAWGQSFIKRDFHLGLIIHLLLQPSLLQGPICFPLSQSHYLVKENLGLSWDQWLRFKRTCLPGRDVLVSVGEGFLRGSDPIRGTAPMEGEDGAGIQWVQHETQSLFLWL